MKQQFIIIVAIFVTLLVFFFWRLLSIDTNKIYAVKLEDLVSSVLVNGTYTTASQIQVGSPTDGVITEIFVDNKQSVKKGDKLFHVESTADEAQKRTALASYLTAKSTLDTDTATLYSLQSTMFSKWQTFYNLATSDTYQNPDKTPKLPTREATEFTTAQDNWLNAQANYQNQQGVIAKDQAALLAAKQIYDQTQSVTVLAPLTGTVINLGAKVNDQVSVLSTATPVLIIADFSNPSVVASVDQVNVPALQVGQKAAIVFDALPDQTFNGTLSQIDTVGTKVQGTANFNVRFTIDSLSSTLKPNMTASITVETARKEQVLTIPTNAIVSKNGENFVQLANKKSQKVTLGLKGLTKVEVTSGLTVGDRIYEE